AGCAAIVFARATPALWLRKAAAISTVVLVGLGAGNAALAAAQQPALYLLWAKGAREPRPLYEKWNPIGRVQVTGDPSTPKVPYRFGLGSLSPRDELVRELDLTVDATSLTVLTHFDGTFAGLDHLKHLVMNLHHFIKSDADVLIVGTGGGRDILSSLAFNQRSIVGVELHGGALDAVHRTFGEYHASLDRNPRVHLGNDEARGFIRGTQQRFDTTQLSLISGVFVLSEQPLYPLEA